MSKITALYEACDTLMNCFYETGLCESCPAYDECQWKDDPDAHEDCIQTLLTYFEKKISNEKKTALYLACKHLSDLAWSLEGNGIVESTCLKLHCPRYESCVHTRVDCTEEWLDYFQQQADIPDGWDVVRELLKIIRTTNKFELESYLENVICTRLRQAGLEVNDERIKS